MTGVPPGTLPGTLPGPTYLVVAKAPEPGRAKTRLSTRLSAHQAAAVAAAALLDTLDVVAAAAGEHDPRPVVAWTGELGRCATPQALQAGLAPFRLIDQRGEGFAARLAAAHRDAAGDFGATVQVGMDTPQLNARTLVEAGARVTCADGPDAVLGPAADGGWWLLALRRAGDARVLAGVPMSTAQTGEATVAALRAAGLRVEFAEELNDVDEPEDLPVVAALAPHTRFAELVAVLGGSVLGGSVPGGSALDRSAGRRRP